MSQTMPLNIQNLNKDFNQTKILQDVNLSLNNNEIFGLIGLNGAGKTTLIKILLDLLSPESGNVEFFGQSNLEPESRKNIAYLPEKFYPSQFLKGQEFLSLSLSHYNKIYNEEIVNKLAENLDLNPKVLSNKINKYSKGMGQKLGLMSIFLTEAPLLILDEPMSGLDPKARIKLKKLLIDYCKNNKTIFFSSHILSDIDEICNRIAILHDSKIIFIGTTEEFKNNYNEENLEKAFLKAINL